MRIWSVFDPAAPGGTSSSGAGQRTPYILSQSAIPFIHLSSGTMGNNGALSGVTALPTTYSGGAWVYLVANAIEAGSAAGWYWCVFSSTTAGTVYNDTYTTGQPSIGTATAFATTGPGAFTGVTTAQQGPAITLPAGAMGVNGALRVSTKVAATNSANSKLFLWRAETTQITPANGQANTLNFDSVHTVQNRGVQTAQVSFPNGGTVYGSGTSASARLFPAVDFSAAQTINFLFNTKGTATDNLILEGYIIEVLPSG